MKDTQFSRFLLSGLLAAALTGGCSKPVERQAAANNAAPPPSVEAVDEPDSVRPDRTGGGGVPTDQWVGRWSGPEGLFLDIQPSPDGKRGHYAITNRDTLDRQADYAGVAEGQTIRFVRDGKALTIRDGIGSETGFKWLVGKSECLIVEARKEGYCR